MNRTLFKITLSCLAALMLIPAVSHAKPGHHRGGGAGMDLDRLERMAEHLELDDKTMATIKKRLYEAQEEGITLRANVEAAQLKVRRSMDEDQPDRGQVMKNLEALSAARLKLRKHRTGVLLDVQAKLSPEQRKKARRHLRKKMHKKFGGKHGGPHHGGPHHGGPHHGAGSK